MTVDRLKAATTAVVAVVLMVGLSACGKDKVRDSCDKPQPHESVVDGKRIDVPEDLDPLDELKEIPIPKAETPPRPDDGTCLDDPPSVLSN